MSTRTTTKAFILGFSAIPIPKGQSALLETGEPNPDMIPLVMDLAMAPPMLSLGFLTENGKNPSVSDIFMVAREKYASTTESPLLNEAYGILLDALKVAQNSPIKLDGEVIELPPDMPEELKSLLYKKHSGQVLLVDEKFVALRLSTVEMHIIKD